MTTYSSIYSFNSNKTIEQFCTDLIRVYSNKFKDIYKPYLMTADKEDGSVIRSASAGVPLTVEEKVAIQMDFEDRKIKKVYRSNDLRIIIIESEDPELEFEFVDSLNTNDNKESTIATTLITNGLRKDIDLSSDEYVNLVSKYAQHMVIVNLAKAGLEYSTGDEPYLNGIIGLSFGSSYSSFYTHLCALFAVYGIIQLLTPEDVNIDKINDSDEISKEAAVKVWNAISEAEYVINNVPDKVICDYISFKTSIDRTYESDEEDEDERNYPNPDGDYYEEEVDDDFSDEIGKEISSLEELSLEEIDDTESGELEDSNAKEE